MRNNHEFDPVSALEQLLAPVGLAIADAGGRVAFAGADPIVPARHRLGACIGIPMMASKGLSVGPNSCGGASPDAGQPDNRLGRKQYPLWMIEPLLRAAGHTQRQRRVVGGLFQREGIPFGECGSDFAVVGRNIQKAAPFSPGLVHVSVTCYGLAGPWADRGGFDMNGSAASGLMVIEGGDGDPKLPPTGMINDFITGYMGALGAAAGLIKQATEGGSWHVTVNLTRTAMWYQTLGLVDPDDAGCDDDHTLREPAAYDAESPMVDIHMLAPPVTFSHTPPHWREPILVPKGSSRPHWLAEGN